MATVYLGQIMLTGFGFAPRGYAACNGQLLPINQNAALFSLLGTQYGGNGTTNFALPNLQSSAPVGAGNSVDPNWQPPTYVQGENGGVENVTLQSQNLPTHSHMAQGTTTAGTVKNPHNTLYGGSGSEAIYAADSGAKVAMSPQTLATAGGNTPHTNMQPFLVVNFNIALTGIFPSRS